MGPQQQPKVLIVDDEPRNLDVLEVMLEPLDCTLVRASSADEALLHLLREDFAAIVLDIRMPDMNGIELASLIKQRKRSQHVPILFLTAHLVEEEEHANRDNDGRAHQAANGAAGARATNTITHRSSSSSCRRLRAVA